jgi:hypothetical protein
MRIALVVFVFSSAIFSFAHGRPIPGLSPNSRDTLDSMDSVRIVKLDEPQYPTLGRQARIQGSVRLSARFLGCTLDPNSVRLVSGHPMLAPVAMRSVERSTIECGDRPNMQATIVYDFQIDSKCHDDKTTSRVIDNRVIVRACPANPPPLP